MTLSDYLYFNRIKKMTFAELIGVSAQSVSSYCNGTAIPNRDTMVAIYTQTNGEVRPDSFYGIASDLGRPI